VGKIYIVLLQAVTDGKQMRREGLFMKAYIIHAVTIKGNANCTLKCGGLWWRVVIKVLACLLQTEALLSPRI
jgi:hypothetical protein